MPVPAGTGLTRRSFVSRSAGIALAVYGATGSAAGARGGHRGGHGGARRRSGAGFDLHVRRRGLAHAAGANRRPPAVRRVAADLALPPGQGTPFSEDTSLRWHPSAAGLATLHAEGKLTVMPAIGYDDPNQSHFTSRHYWEVGEVNPFGRWGWLGRYLDRHGAADNPLQGLTLGYDLSPALAASSVPVATVPRPDDYDFWTPGSGTRSRCRCSMRSQSSATAHGRPRAPLRARRGGGDRAVARAARALRGPSR